MTEKPSQGSITKITKHIQPLVKGSAAKELNDMWLYYLRINWSAMSLFFPYVLIYVAQFPTCYGRTQKFGHMFALHRIHVEDAPDTSEKATAFYQM